MNDRSKGLLFDALEAAKAIRLSCETRSFEDYEADRQVRRAVEREFEIIGEALVRLRDSDPETAARILGS